MDDHWNSELSLARPRQSAPPHVERPNSHKSDAATKGPDKDRRADPWIAGGADVATLSSAGVKAEGGGTHQSKTLMLADLTTLLGHVGTNNPGSAIRDENVLGKPSRRARSAALKRLRELYGVGSDAPIWLALAALWDRDPTARPLLALLCALARDPTLRDGAAAVLDAPIGEPVRAPAIASAFESRHPGRLGASTLKSLSRNAASSWTQTGFLDGVVRKTRVRPNATPTVAAYAALLASLCGFGGTALLGSRWLDILDRPVEDRLSLLRQAEGLGLARVRSAGDVVEINVRRPLANALGVPGLVHS